jgi:hypothetical protein
MLSFTTENVRLFNLTKLNRHLINHEFLFLNMYDEMDEMGRLASDLNAMEGGSDVNYTAETRRYGYPNYVQRLNNQPAPPGGTTPAGGTQSGSGAVAPVEPPCMTDFPKWGDAWGQKWMDMANKVGADSFNVYDDCPQYDDPVEACYRDCNMKVKQHNINCRLALKLYSEYLKSIGCKGAACTFTPTDGCTNKGKTCPPPTLGMRQTRRGGRSGRKRTVRRR